MNLQAIQERSYEIWEREGRPHGRDLEHWRLAETELVSEVVAVVAPKAKKAPAARKPARAKAA